MANNGRKPDYDVCFSEKPDNPGDRRFAYRIGAAWVGNKGQINVRLAVPVVAPTELVLFERRDEPEQR